ncbi:porin family protein [Fulvimarina endophytica]|uniref:Porin family protein n=2 Tax=Fulvimarina endophytica TaxID=2293836 RepID=A0A371X820_9HYPH|nr:porin family protein [Fulvimarina endophytica]
MAVLGPFAAVPALAQEAPAPERDTVFPEARLPETALPVRVWSGPYAGAFVGYNISRFDDLRGASVEGEGVVGGVYGGFNIDGGPIVYGIEGDIGGGDFDAAANGVTGRPDIQGETNVFGSLRGRVGVPMDPFLVYGTGGLALADTQLTLDGASDTRTSVGYTVGAGVEAKVTDRVNARVEYRYSDFGSSDYELGKTSVSSGFDEHSVRAGVSLDF